MHRVRGRHSAGLSKHPVMSSILAAERRPSYLRRQSQAQTDGSLDCVQTGRNHDPSLHDVQQAIVRQLLGNLPGERHEPAPVCDMKPSSLRLLNHNEVPVRISCGCCCGVAPLPSGRSRRGISLGQQVAPGRRPRSSASMASAISWLDGREAGGLDSLCWSCCNLPRLLGALGRFCAFLFGMVSERVL